MGQESAQSAREISEINSLHTTRDEKQQGEHRIRQFFRSLLERRKGTLCCLFSSRPVLVVGNVPFSLSRSGFLILGQQPVHLIDDRGELLGVSFPLGSFLMGSPSFGWFVR